MPGENRIRAERPRRPGRHAERSDDATTDTVDVDRALCHAAGAVLVDDLDVAAGVFGDGHRDRLPNVCSCDLIIWERMFGVKGIKRRPTVSKTSTYRQIGTFDVEWCRMTIYHRYYSEK